MSRWDVWGMSVPGEAIHYDYDYADDDAEHLYEVFRVRDGKRVAWADTEQQARERIDSLERHLPVG